MSRPQYGSDMDRPSTGDIIRRARERAEAGLPREDYETFLRRQAAMKSSPSSTPEIPPRSRPPLGSPDSGNGLPRQQRPQAPRGFQDKDGQITLPISRPAPVPQWPLAGPLAAPAPSNAEPYRPPVGSSPPQRPPRPSHVPSILDGSKIQDPTPSFQYQSRNSSRDSEGVTSSVPETPSTLSRPSTLSSVGSIPDFPLPIQAPPPPTMGPPRRSVNLGPPPSARRGASSFYSHLSYVSPIPEESPRRSHTSYASSAAMPESWGTPSPMDSPRYDDEFYDDTIVEERTPSEGMSMQEEDGDESRLVRSASLGRRGKAALVTTAAPGPRESVLPPEDDYSRPYASPVQPSPFNDGTGYVEASSNSSNTVPSTNTSKGTPVGAALTADAILTAYDAASAVDPRTSRRLSNSPNAQTDPTISRGFSRLSAIRRPPKLDIDAVRQAETRGSLTSLPDLIRRATRLAASLDRGRRPASRFDMDDFPPEFYAVGGGGGGGGGGKRQMMNVDQDSDEYFDDKHRSGLSDMLAAFPPPAQAQSRTGVRQSVRGSVLSWPLPPLNARNGFGTPRSGQDGEYSTRGSTPESQKKGRRCCGLPLWGFILLVVILIILIAAAIIIPIEFFVVRRQNTGTNTTAAAEQQCQNQLTCKNGGSNVVTNGICSCICTNGFTGFDCSTSDTVGCVTTTIAGDTNISNVTLGNAIPRLLTQASTNFSITLSETNILSKLNAGNLSCSSQNALVTFDGQSARTGAALAAVLATDSTGTIANNVVQADAVVHENIATVTIMQGSSLTTTLTVDGGTTSIPPTTTVTITKTLTSSFVPSTTTTSTSTSTSTALTTSAASTTIASTTTSATAIPATTSTAAFTVTEQVLDFARVGVLFVLQQDSLNEATTAQSTLQTFFSSGTTGLTVTAARNVSLSNGNSIDLVDFHVDAGTGVVGALTTSTKRDLEGVVAIDFWGRGLPLG